MPTTTPVLSWEQIRNYTERWSWLDPKTGARCTGFNPPDKARDRRQVPYHVRAIASDGHLVEGQCITLKVDLRRRQRKVKFVPSGQVRILRDYLIISVDGIRFVTH